jgi:Tol biopolymer transport system component
MRWSPDGRQIAIVVDLRENQYASETSETLLVANLAAGTLTEYVLPEGTADSFGFPLWSPDSRQLAIESWVDPNATQTLLIDLETELFVQVASNARPVAWLAPQH